MWSTSAPECRRSVIVIMGFSLSIVLPEYTTFIYEMGGRSLGIKAVVLRVDNKEGQNLVHCHQLRKDGQSSASL